MKYVITEQQNDRVIDMIKQFAEQYTERGIVRTEVEVEYDPKKELYILYPIFYVKERGKFPYRIFKHALAQFKHALAQKVEDYMGFPVHSGSARVKVIKNEE
jgi:hypothetical protein